MGSWVMLDGGSLRAVADHLKRQRFKPTTPQRRLTPVGLVLRGIILTAAVLAVPAAAVLYRVQTVRPVLDEAGIQTVSAEERAPFTVGMNVAGITDWSTEWPFVDVFMHSREWIPQRQEGGPWDTKEELRLTPEGWPILAPGQAAATLMLRECSPHYPAGRYVCTWEGTGRIEFGMAAKVASQSPGRAELDVRHDDGGIYLKIVESSPADPIRNIRVWMPGFEGAESPFHPLYLERLRPFKVLRFMDWQRTNHSKVTTWEDRRTPAHARQSGPPGVALEYIIALTNELKADPWFCMPHLADDEYVRNFAEQVKRELHPDATIYVEWTNEPWNGMFGQAKWAQEQAAQRGLEPAEVVADEAKRDWRIWQEVFEGDGRRIVRVAAAHHYNPDFARRLMDRLDGEVDALACGGYFKPRKEDEAAFGAATTAQDVLLSCQAELRENGLPRLAAHQRIAETWSQRLGRPIPLIVYEGGQHLTPNGRDLPYTGALLAAQTHPLMEACYRELLDGFRDMGGSAFMAFASCGGWGRHGYWGLLEYQDQPIEEAIKYRVVLEYAKGGERGAADEDAVRVLATESEEAEPAVADEGR